ncbi:MAG: FhuF 2Fe-2S C-terminal domain [Pseudonocardia sp.]|nr:FhuF 2Fe-2S C-terminal domain [Pseudonocardia sp.]
MSQAVKPVDQQEERRPSALADTLRRLDQLVPRQAVLHGRPAGPEWTNLGTLVDDGLLVDVLERLADHFHAAPDQSTVRPGSPLAAHALIARAALPAAALGAAVFGLRRLPLPRLGDLAVRWADSGARVDAIAIADAELLVLPDDELAGHEGVRVVPDLDAMHKELMAGVYDIYRPLVELTSRLGHRGLRALWQVVSDRVATGHIRAGRVLGRQAAAKAEVEQLLTIADKPLLQQPVWLEVEHDGVEHVFKQLSVCCLAYKTPARPDGYCATCPLLGPGESETLLRSRMAGSARA